jgi:hypothetical protein
MVSDNDERVCRRCGAPLTPADAKPQPPGAIETSLCPQCASDAASARSLQRGGLNAAAVLLSVGAFVLFMSALADWFAFGSAEGFGWKQLLGLGLGGILFLTGAVTRVPTLFVIGLIFGLLALLADWLGFGSAPGFGWHQISGCVLGGVLITLGLLRARRSDGGRRSGNRHP